MTKNKQIFVVTQGDYSDYHIIGIFNSFEKAEIYHQTFKKNDDINPIEEHNLNPYQYELKNGYKSYTIEMKRNGDIVKITKLSGLQTTEPYVTYNRQSMIHICVAKDEKHAIKIANEKRAILIAYNKW